MISLLIDENVPLASVNWLRDKGYNTLSVLEQRPGATDEAIAAWSAETNRLVVTFDRDFGDLIFHRKVQCPAGVVLLRFIPSFPIEPAVFVHQLIERLGTGVFGHLTSLDRTHARQRPLPSE